MRFAIAAALASFLVFGASAQDRQQLYQQHQQKQIELDSIAKQLRDYTPPVTPPPDPDPPPPPPPTGVIVQTFDASESGLTSNDYSDTNMVPRINGADPEYMTVRGTISLTAVATRYGAPAHSIAAVRVRYKINGIPVSPVDVPGKVQLFDTTTLSNSSGHCLSVDVVEGDIATIRGVAKRLIVANGPAADRKIAVTGADYQSNRLGSPHCDVIDMPSLTRPDGAASPMPYVYSAPVSQRAIDPKSVVLNNTKWMVGPLAHTPSTLYVPTPQVEQTLDGRLTMGNFPNQSTDNVTDALGPQDRTAYPDGPRNIGGVSPYGQAFSRAGVKGWHRCEITGRVTSNSETGEVRTIFGPKLKDGIIPMTRGLSAIPTATIVEHNKEFVGRLEGGALPMRGVHDCQWLDDETILATDSFNHYLGALHVPTQTLKVFCGQPVPMIGGSRQAGSQVDGPCATAKMHLPYGAIRGPPGTPQADTVWFVDIGDSAGNQGALRKVQNGIVTTVLDLTGRRPFVNRWFSDGTMLVLEQGVAGRSGPRAMNYNPATGAYTVLTTSITQANWIWANVDIKGNLGPKDDFFVSSSTGGYGNVDLRRYSRTGAEYSTDSKREFTGNYGRASQGHMLYVADPQTHYPWDNAIHADEAKMLTSGFGTMGVNEIRLYNDGESKGVYNDTLYKRGMSVITNGTVPGFGLNVRPSFTALRNQFGHTRSGLPNFDDMQGWSDQQIGTYLEAGFGGAVPRPELRAAYWQKLAIAFIRHNTPAGQSYPFPADIAKKAIVVRDLTMTRNGTKISGRWTTDEDTVGVVACGAQISGFTPWGKQHQTEVDTGTAGPRSCKLRVMNLPGQQSVTTEQTIQ
jgi:hypothetical protein